MAERVRTAYQRATDADIPLRIPSHDDAVIKPTVVSSAVLDRLLPPSGQSLDDAISETVHFCLNKRTELPR